MTDTTSDTTETAKGYLAKTIILPLLLSILISQSASAHDPLFSQGEDWKLSYDKNNLEIYTKRLDGHPVKAVKGVTRIKTNLESVATAITDADSLSSWFPYMKSSELLQAPDIQGHSYTYIISNLPWPIKDRDVLYANKITYNEDMTEIYLYSNVIQDDALKSLNPKFVRIPASEALWRAKAIDNETVEVELYAHADPGGAIPKWFTNLVVIQAPKESLMNLREFLESADPDDQKPIDTKKVFGRQIQLVDTSTNSAL